MAQQYPDLSPRSTINPQCPSLSRIHGDLGDTISAAVTPTPTFIKHHGTRTALQLTPAGKAYVARRIAELCDQRTPGQEIAAKINREIGLNWTPGAYYHRIKNSKLSWTPAPHRPPNAPYLLSEKREACRQDPAYEARNGIADRVICRECFIILRNGCMTHHLQTQHGIDVDQYHLRHPGARIFTLQSSANRSTLPGRRDVQKLMAEFADKYATPEERKAAQDDPNYEARNGITNYVICRVARCGFKATAALPEHLWNMHGEMPTKTYRQQHRHPAIFPPGALTEDRMRAAQRRAASWRPANWWEKPMEWRIIGDRLLSTDYMSNADLFSWLDSSRILPCSYADTWADSMNKQKCSEEKMKNCSEFIRKIRAWVKKPGKIMGKKSAA